MALPINAKLPLVTDASTALPRPLSPSTDGVAAGALYLQPTSGGDGTVSISRNQNSQLVLQDAVASSTTLTTLATKVSSVSVDAPLTSSYDAPTRSYTIGLATPLTLSNGGTSCSGLAANGFVSVGAGGTLLSSVPTSGTTQTVRAFQTSPGSAFSYQIVPAGTLTSLSFSGLFTYTASDNQQGYWPINRNTGLYTDAVADANTALLWPMNESSLTADAVDTSGNGYHLTAYTTDQNWPIGIGPSRTARVVSGQQYFQRLGDATLGSLFNGDWTIEFVRGPGLASSTTPGYSQAVLCYVGSWSGTYFSSPKASTNSDIPLVDIYIDYNLLTVRVWLGTTSYQQVTAGFAPAYGWHWFGVTKTRQPDGKDVYKLFVDGVLATTSLGLTPPAGVTGENHRLGVGCCPATSLALGSIITNSSALSGASGLADVRVHNVAKPDSYFSAYAFNERFTYGQRAGAALSGTLALGSGGTGVTSGPFTALSPVSTKGGLVVHDGTNNTAITVGANTTVLKPDSAQATGLAWSPVNQGTFVRAPSPTVFTEAQATTGVNSTVYVSSWTPTVGTTDCDVALLPLVNSSGASGFHNGNVVTRIPTASTVGGNVRGSYATDLNLFANRSTAASVAGGAYSALFSGANNPTINTTGTNSVIVAAAVGSVSGTNCSNFIAGTTTSGSNASAVYTGTGTRNAGSNQGLLSGRDCTTCTNGFILANCVSPTARNFNAGTTNCWAITASLNRRTVSGYLLHVTTTNASTYYLSSGTSNASTSTPLNTLTMALNGISSINSAGLVRGYIIGVEASTNSCKVWSVSAALRKVNGTQAGPFSTTRTVIGETGTAFNGYSDSNINFTGSISNFTVTVVGIASKTLRFFAKLYLTEVVDS